MSTPDVAFANLYFAAIAAGDVNPSRAPSAWRPLLCARRNSGIARPQFALAGMNAHINRDLPQGIVQVFEALGGDPSSDEARHQDFDSVNDLLERVEGEVKADFSTGVIGVVDVSAAVSTISQRCGTCVWPEKRRGRTLKCCGHSEISRPFAARSSTHSTDPQDLLGADSSSQRRSILPLRNSHTVERRVAAGAGSGEVINLSVLKPSDNFADPRWSLVIIRNFTSLGRLRW